MKTEFLTWEQVIHRGFKEVTVESYGYVEHNIFGSHFEPFKTKRSFIFSVYFIGLPWDDDEEDFDTEDFYALRHEWLNLSDFEYDLNFELREDGKVYLNDPDLCSYG